MVQISFLLLVNHDEHDIDADNNKIPKMIMKITTKTTTRTTTKQIYKKI